MDERLQFLESVREVVDRLRLFAIDNQVQRVDVRYANGLALVWEEGDTMIFVEGLGRCSVELLDETIAIERAVQDPDE